MSVEERFDKELREALQSFAGLPSILLATDFDGTISRITNRFAEAELLPQAGSALRSLSEMPGTTICVISGRSLGDLRPRFDHLPRVRLIGSHGYEFDPGELVPLTPEQLEMRQQVKSIMERYQAQCPGSAIETKDYSTAFHYRMVEPAIAEQFLPPLRRELTAVTGIALKEGKCVVECLSVQTNKGAALTRVRESYRPQGTIFIGDDATDEDAFAALAGNGLTIKVGPGRTQAQYRIEDPSDTALLIQLLLEYRAQALSRLPDSQISDHVFLSDLRSGALLDPRGTVVWQCLPRFDSPPIFSALLGGATAGFFSVTALEDSQLPHQQYEDDALISVTSWSRITVIDYLICSEQRALQRAGRSDFMRHIRGSGVVEVVFAPRLDFGRVATRLSVSKEGVTVEGGTLPMILVAPGGWKWTVANEGHHQTATGVREFRDEEVVLELRSGTRSFQYEKVSPAVRLEQTRRYWSSWVDTLQLPKSHEQLLSRSAQVMRGLIYGPNGAAVAAVTTSLPETLGGVRNWDYRFCWPRDSALTATALARLGDVVPGIRLLDWFFEVFEDSGAHSFLGPVYTITGAPLMGEAEIENIWGYGGSRPVRIGNLAANQLQLDVLGPIAALLRTLAERGVPLSYEHGRLAEQMVELVQTRWHEADSGIWEIRGEPRHYVHSKLMCWYAVAECIRVGEYLALPTKHWVELRDQIRADIEQHGFSESKNAYVSAYGFEEPDAAVLWLFLTNFHAPDHPRMRSTLNWLRDTLYERGTMYRYRFDDGLPGKEGGFHICLAWLVSSLQLIGDHDEAQRLLDELIGLAEPHGLLSEQWEPDLKKALGNYPQAYSHIGLVNAVLDVLSPKETTAVGIDLERTAVPLPL